MVVLVLAIAGLIFLMVFIALPALQRSQRDTQRRNDMSALASQITQYQSNNNGKLPKADATSKIAAVDESDTTNGAITHWCDAKNNAAANFICNYMNASGASENTFKDPDGWMYGLEIVDMKSNKGWKMPVTVFGDNGGDNKYKIYLVEHAQCDGEDVKSSENARDYAILYKLEGAGTYCNDNN